VVEEVPVIVPAHELAEDSGEEGGDGSEDDEEAVEPKRVERWIRPCHEDGDARRRAG
jgi:hypothetical protein